MTNIRNTLSRFAHDAELNIASCDGEELVLRVRLPSRGDEEWEIRIASPIHLDMNPRVTLGSVEFGDLSLLPDGYIATRNLDYGGDLANYRVLRITDDDEKLHFIVCDHAEEIVPRRDG